MKRLEGKIAIVTGAAMGLGASVARLFVAEGARVVLGDVNDAEGSALAQSLGANAFYRHLDVGSEADWHAAIEKTVTKFGPPTVLVNNAGIYRVAPMESLSVDAYMQTIRINQLGVFLGMRSVIAPMKQAGGGSIVNISSIAGLQGIGNAIAYTASKYAVRGMTKSAAQELGPFGIRVNSVHPGAMVTPLLAQSLGADIATLEAAPAPGIPLARMGRADEIARLVLYVASDEASYSTGSEFVADGGLIAGQNAAPVDGKPTS